MACHYVTNRFQMKASVAPSRRLQEASVGMAEAFAKPSAPATSSRSAREDVANPSRRRHGEYPWVSTNFDYTVTNHNVWPRETWTTC